MLIPNSLERRFGNIGSVEQIREKQGITRLVFKTPLGQGVFVKALSCSYIFSCETWSR